MLRACFAYLFLLISMGSGAQTPDPAKEILNQSIACLGGDSLLNRIESVFYSGYSYRNAIEQSERPDGPFIFEPAGFKFYIDLHRKLLYQQTNGQMFTFADDQTRLADSSSYAESQDNSVVPALQDRLMQDENDLSPLSIYYTALKSKDLHLQRDTILQRNPQKVLAFSWHHFPVKVFINSHTHFLTAYEMVKPYNDDFLDVWGDSKKMVYYSFWFLEPNGLHYPYQKDIYINGWHYGSEMITGFEINKYMSADSIKIADSVKLKNSNLQKQRSERWLQNISRNAVEIKKDIRIIPGPCTTTIVRQTDGVVIIEGSKSSEYARIILNKVHELYRSEKIKAVISTSDAWLHIGGLREFAAQNIPIYHLDLNEFIIRKLLSADYKTNPDSWQKTKNKHPVLISVSRKLVLGSGDNQLQLIPYRTETGERMMMVYFTKQNLLYASDLYQPKGPDGTYWEPHYPFEVCSAVDRERLPVQLLYAMHLAVPTPFSEIKKDLTNHFQPDTRASKSE
jgi:hypothetical protein